MKSFFNTFFSIIVVFTTFFSCSAENIQLSKNGVSDLLAQKKDAMLLHINTQSPFAHGVEFSYDSVLYQICLPEARENTWQQLLHNPCSLLKSNDTIVERFCYSGFGQKECEKITPETFKTLAQKNPLCFIRECTSCPLNRQKHPQRRAFCEKKITNDIENHFPKNKQLTLVAFAAGDLLSETIILSRLVKAGFADINVVLIDPRWRDEYITGIKGMGECVPLAIQDTNLEKENWLRMLTYQMAQFVQWLQAASSSIKVIVYNDIKKYQQDCRQNASLAADVIVAVDYFTTLCDGIDADSFYAISDLNQLFLSTLKQDGRLYECEALNFLGVEGQPFADVKGSVLRISKKLKLLSYSVLDELDTQDSNASFVSFSDLGIKLSKILPLRFDTAFVCSVDNLDQPFYLLP